MGIYEIEWGERRRNEINSPMANVKVKQLNSD